MKCERCPATAGGYLLFDYCATCSRNLCEKCMTKGCCGATPAQSGMARDDGEEEQEPDQRDQPCPTCKEENKLTPADVRQGYQCDRCADAEEGAF